MVKEALATNRAILSWFASYKCIINYLAWARKIDLMFHWYNNNQWNIKSIFLTMQWITIASEVFMIFSCTFALITSISCACVNVNATSDQVSFWWYLNTNIQMIYGAPDHKNKSHSIRIDEFNEPNEHSIRLVYHLDGKCELWNLHVEWFKKINPNKMK